MKTSSFVARKRHMYMCPYYDILAEMRFQSLLRNSRPVGDVCCRRTYDEDAD